jgi:hypothetical protein
MLWRCGNWELSQGRRQRRMSHVGIEMYIRGALERYVKYCFVLRTISRSDGNQMAQILVGILKRI